MLTNAVKVIVHHRFILPLLKVLFRDFKVSQKSLLEKSLNEKRPYLQHWRLLSPSDSFVLENRPAAAIANVASKALIQVFVFR